MDTSSDTARGTAAEALECASADPAPAEAAASDEQRKPALGIALMAVAMLIIPGSDAIAKYLSPVHSPVFLSWARYVAALGFVLPVVLFQQARSREPLISRGQILPQLVRTAFLVGAMTLYFVAIARIPLADALGAYFVAPIIATLLAAMVLRERLDRRKLAAVLLGFAGALLVVRPGTAGSAGTLIALASGGLMACYLVMTRATAQASPPLSTLTIQLVFGILLLTPFLLFQWTTPSWEALALILLMGLLAAAANLMTISAFRLAQVSTLSPLVYLELLGATALGFVLFGDLPSVTTWIGIAVIVAAGFTVVTPRRAVRRSIAKP
ncbi:DMT family transporter [Bosea sp. (in: a-proteobacteria)]|jgi:drug/metabolite transporter (DMT)-like permease|uniref:DMT family transporter n=1 Tax=Bosea sp. (in: a-proteobacteria) TaxID=1871050 RepID=UPI003F70C8CC